jgi:hypothetical protein
MNKWNAVVKQMWEKNKHTAGYMFKNALKDAKKVYNGGKTTKARKSVRKGGKTRKHR